MNEKTKLYKRIRFYLVSSVVLPAVVALVFMCCFLPPIVPFGFSLIFLPTFLLALVFSQILFVNALIIMAKMGRIYPPLKRLGIFGGVAAAVFPVLSAVSIVLYFWLLSNAGSETPTLLCWIIVVAFNPLTSAIALIVIHIVVVVRAGRVVQADLSQLAQ